MSALREQLIEIIRQMPEDRLALIAPVVEQHENEQWRSPQESLKRARAIRARMKKRYGLMPDSVDILDEVREESLNDILDMR